VSEFKIEVGTIVHHPKRPGWGPGRALEVGGGGQITVYFRDLEELEAGDAVKTIATNVIGLEIEAEQSDPMLDNLPPYSKGRFEGVRKPRLNLDQAVRLFCDSHPGAFSDSPSKRSGRDEWIRAHESWMAVLGGDQLKELLDQGDVDEASRRTMTVSSKLDLLTPQEHNMLDNALGEETMAEPLLRALEGVVEETGADQPSFQGLIDAVDALPERDVGPRFSTWPVLTLLPFVARPDKHMLFRPSIVRKCASRLNFNLNYNTKLNWWSYEQLLEMAGILLRRLQPLGARDFIDVQCFVSAMAKI